MNKLIHNLAYSNICGRRSRRLPSRISPISRDASEVAHLAHLATADLAAEPRKAKIGRGRKYVSISPSCSCSSSSTPSPPSPLQCQEPPRSSLIAVHTCFRTTARSPRPSPRPHRASPSRTPLGHGLNWVSEIGRIVTPPAYYPAYWPQWGTVTTPLV